MNKLHTFSTVLHRIAICVFGVSLSLAYMSSLYGIV